MLLIYLPEWIEYFDYPGLELWKFLNLAIFLTAAIIILRKPIRNALIARGEGIKVEIQKAQAERDQAGAKLAEAEALWAQVKTDVQGVRDQTSQEADAERQRQVAVADQEIERLKTQAAREMESARKASHKELQQFLANRSLEIAKQSVINELRPEDDLRLIRERIGELRRARG
jgi:F-type H+-transporting ATPase subunit b